MRKCHLFSVLSLFLLLSASIIRGQTIISQKGLTTAVFPTQYGNVKVYLPDDIRAGDVISGTVVTEPTGNHARQKEKNLAELMKFLVRIDSNKYSLSDKPASFTWVVPQDRRLSSPLELLHVSAFTAGQLTIQFKLPEFKLPVVRECYIPSHALTGNPVRISGMFDGNASNTQCSIGNVPLEIIAESPRQCMIRFPLNASGLHTMQIRERGQEICNSQISGVDMQVTTGDLNLRKGQSTFMDVKLTGLQNLPDTAWLSITNNTPGIVTMTNGNVQKIPVLPSADPAQGIFLVHCPATSIASGIFSVTINLELPEIMLSPAPNANQENKAADNPVTVQGPKCQCVVQAGISLFKNEAGMLTFIAMPRTDCRGPECAYQKNISFKWQLAEGNNNGEITETSETGFTIKVKQKNKGGFTIKNTATITCSDGTSCSDDVFFNEKGEELNNPADKDKTDEPRQPTEPQQPEQGGGCTCDGNCKIIQTGAGPDEVSYDAIVDAICKGYIGGGSGSVTLCEASYKLEWHMSDKSKEVADITGPTDKKQVKLKIKKPGQYVLNLKVTITCSDGTECIRNCNVEVTVPPPLPQPPFCVLSWQENDLPKMTGRLKPKFAAKYTIRRDEFIPLGAEGKDDDQLIWSCTPVNPPCKESGGSRNTKLNGRVRFEWIIKKGEGSFVKLGCLPDNELKAYGDYTIFRPPVVPLPVVAMDTTVTTIVQLRIIDDNPTQPQDETIKKDIIITTKRSRLVRDKMSMDQKMSTDKIKAWPEIMLKEDLYEITVTSETLEEKVAAVPAITSSPACKPLGPQFTANPQMGKPEIVKPDVEGKEIVLLGQWVVLNAKDVRDKDTAKKIFCESKTCIVSPPHKKGYEDNVQFHWRIELGKGDKAKYGKFGNDLETDVGAAVIFKTPDVWPATVKEDYFDIKISMYAFNPDGGDRKDVMTSAMKITIRVYKPGIKLEKTPPEWLPEENNTVSLASRLIYSDGRTWNPAPPHACRIHFFELMNVSRLKGICMNYPEPDKADNCRDLFIPVQKNLEVFNDTTSGNCATDSLFMQARTLKPVHGFSVNIQSGDYASFGFLRSFANLNRGGRDSIRGEKPVYIPLKEPYSIYSDNRVTIPQDQDENGIADRGWVVKGGVLIPDPKGPANEDKDDKPKGNSIAGDGLTEFEEYRGFKTSKIELKARGKPGDKDVIMSPEEQTPHRRTNPTVKDVFVRNKDGFTITLFRQVTGLDVHEINVRQYISDEKRIVNFNVIPGKHLTDQMGLYLYDGKTHPALLGCAWNNIKLSGIIRPTPPNWQDSIVVYRTSTEHAVAAINEEVSKINKDLAKAKKPLLKELAVDVKLSKVIAHELCHAVNICHHGEGDPSVKNDHDNVNGLRSGNMDCIMRYDNTGTTVAGYFPEDPGKSLCVSPAGTGYNPDKFGHAATGRGNCQNHLQVTAINGLPPYCLGDKDAWKKYHDEILKKKKAEEKSKK
jgi:hypothetical protein